MTTWCKTKSWESESLIDLIDTLVPGWSWDFPAFQWWNMVDMLMFQRC